MENTKKEHKEDLHPSDEILDRMVLEDLTDDSHVGLGLTHEHALAIARTSLGRGLRIARDKWLAPSQWISLEERLPPIHEEPFPESGFVLILLQHEGWKPDTWRTMKASRTFGEWDENGDPLWVWSDEDGEVIEDDDNLITHWMEIPSPNVGLVRG